jgi:hypothetical protein
MIPMMPKPFIKPFGSFRFVVGTRQKAELSMAQQLDKAQQLHQQAFVETVKRNMRRLGGTSLSYQPR